MIGSTKHVPAGMAALIVFASMVNLVPLHARQAYHRYDPVEALLQYRFCTSRGCNNLTQEARNDYAQIRHNADRRIHSLWTLLSFETEQESTDWEIQKHVADSAYEHARNLGASAFQANQVSTTIVAMVEQAQRKNTQGNCNQFIGAGLKHRTKTLLQELRQKYTQPSSSQNDQIPTVEYRPTTDYSSDSDPCVACTTTHIPKKDRVFFPKEQPNLRSYSDNIYLYESCGHFLCIGCTQRWFVGEDKDTCPSCRGKVDKTILKKVVAFKNEVKTQEARMSQNGYNPAPEGMSYQPGAAYPRPSAPPYHE